MDLPEVPPPAPFSAAVADGATPGNALSGYVVRAVAVPGETLALATVPLGAHRRDANLVGEAGLGPARDDPLARALVAVEGVLGVKLEESETSKVVGGERLLL